MLRQWVEHSTHIQWEVSPPLLHEDLLETMTECGPLAEDSKEGYKGRLHAFNACALYAFPENSHFEIILTLLQPQLLHRRIPVS